MKAFRWISLGILWTSLSAGAVDFDKVKTDLESTDGLNVYIHGIDTKHSLYVLIVRGKDFFDFAQVPMVAGNRAAAAQLATLHRHDFVRIKGTIEPEVRSPQKHILVESIEVTRPFDLGGLPPYERKAKLPDDLKGLSEIIVKVHAIVDEGRIMVVEYKDTNIPVINDEPERVKGLYRSDKIRMKFTIAKHPRMPVHLQIAKVPDAITVLRSVKGEHERKIDSLCGQLVMFPKSPEIKFNVFAVKHDIGDGYDWTYTLINFEDPDVFKTIREKLQAEWDRREASAIRGRNYYINPDLITCVSGTGNESHSFQANPQVLLDSPEQITFP